MHEYALSHLADEVLLRDLANLVAQDRATTAILLAHIAEVDARKLYVPAGYPSMHAYCVEELHLSEDAAYKRIRVARAARQFPAIFTALAAGQLHLAAAYLLTPHITQENAKELIVAATHKRKNEVEEFLARRFVLPETMARIRVIPGVPPAQLAPGPVEDESRTPGEGARSDSASPMRHPLMDPPSIGGGEGPEERYFLQLTIPKSTREKLRYAQALLSHAVPGGDPAHVFDRALDALILQLEKRKFGGAGVQPSRPRVSFRKRHIPVAVRRAVWERDQGRCTFVGTNGKRCTSIRLLEFDHIEPLAWGGRATVEGMRLRCRAHNQFEAERAFGIEFMGQKRHERRLAAAEAREFAEAHAGETAAAGLAEERTRAEAEAIARAAGRERTQDLLAGLRSLGCKADEARRAAEVTGTLYAATLEEHIHAAIAFLGRRSASRLRGSVRDPA
jgi:hypothetical protein